MKFISKDTVTKEALGVSLYAILGGQVPLPKCQRAITELVEIIKTSVDEYGMMVRVRGFGTLGLVRKRARKGRNLRTGGVIEIKGYDKPFFRVSKEWCASVKERTPKREEKMNTTNDNAK